MLEKNPENSLFDCKFWGKSGCQNLKKVFLFLSKVFFTFNWTWLFILKAFICSSILHLNGNIFTGQMVCFFDCKDRNDNFLKLSTIFLKKH